MQMKLCCSVRILLIDLCFWLFKSEVDTISLLVSSTSFFCRVLTGVPPRPPNRVPSTFLQASSYLLMTFALSLPVKHVRCDVDEAPLWLWQGVSSPTPGQEPLNGAWIWAKLGQWCWLNRVHTFVKPLPRLHVYSVPKAADCVAAAGSSLLELASYLPRSDEYLPDFF